MPRKKQNARKTDKPKKIHVRPNAKVILLNPRKFKTDYISPGELVAVAEYRVKEGLYESNGF